MNLLKIGLFLVAVWMGLVLLAIVFQRRLIYVPFKLTDVSPASWNMPELKLVQLTTVDGESLVAWYRPAEKHQATLVYFHGNAGHIGMWATVLKPYIRAGYGAIIVDYRGYGASTGKPTEQGLYIDGRAVMDYLFNKGVSAQCIVLFGHSLGTGIAVQLATEYPIGGLVLQSPYTSMTALGKLHYPYMPVGWFLKDRYDSKRKMGYIQSPLLVLYGTEDAVVPALFSQHIYEAAHVPKSIVAYRAGHK